MEEADALLLSSLAPVFEKLNCPAPDSVSKLIDANGDLSLYSVCLATIDMITPPSKPRKSYSLPKGMSSKHRQTTSVANSIKDLGFQGTCGYNNLLYPNEEGARDILRFLTGRIGEEEEEDDGGGEVKGGDKDIMESARKHREETAANGGWGKGEWLPASWGKSDWQTFKWGGEVLIMKAVENSGTKVRDGGCFVYPTVIDANGRELAKEAREQKLKDWKRNHAGEMNALDADLLASTVREGLIKGLGGSTKQATFQDMVKSILGRGDGEGESAIGGNAFGNKVKYGKERGAVAVAGATESKEVETEEDKESRRKEKEAKEKEERERELEALKEKLRKIVEEREKNRKDVQAMEGMKREYDDTAEERKKKLDEAKRQYKMKKQLVDMMGDREGNEKKLREVIKEAELRIKQLREEWAQHRDPMVEKLEAMRSSEEARRKARQDKIDAIKRMREEIAEMATQIRQKEQLAEKLKKDWGKMPKNVNRNVYTYRILDIINSIAKQKAEIRRIITDIKDVQKSINKISETLVRTELVADETLYSMAKAGKGGKQTEAHVRSYRLLMEMREFFEKLVDTVSAAGKAENSKRELESKTELLRARVSGVSVEGIVGDLEKVKKENKDLIRIIKAAQGR